MNRHPTPDPDEADLFRRAVGEVTPVRQERAPPRAARPKPVAAQRLADEAAVVRETRDGFFDVEAQETGDELLYQGPGIQDQVFRKLRRGRFTVEQELDLHGHTVQQARDGLAEFLRQCLARNRRCVRVIHGKGLRSKQGRPTIKSLIGTWLQQRQEVLAYCSARRVDGGTGAIYVLLKGASKN